MRIKVFGAACLVASGVLALGLPSSGWAQGTKGSSGTISGAVDIGGRAFTDEPTALQKGKFLEYKDLASGAVLEQLLLRYTPADSFGVYQLSARNVGQRDQSAWLRASRPGMYDFQVRYDGIPHTFSTTARSPGNEANTGFNALPIPRPDSVAWRNAPYLGAIREEWQPIKASLTLTPTTELDSRIEYSQIGKSGGRPNGLTFSGSSGPSREYVQPIDETMNDIRVSQSYANKDFQLSASYAYSMFQNNRKSAMVDSPLNATDTPTNGAATSRVSFAPDNSAQTISAVAAVNLPVRTRVTGNVSYSSFKQDQAFFAQTSNSLLASDPTLALPRSSLNGQATTTTANFGLTTHPIANLAVAAKVRTYDYGNSTPALHLKSFVVSDRTITPADSQDFEAKPFSKNNADVSASYRLFNALSLSAGYAWETWNRDSSLRNLAKTTETTPRVSLDYTGLDWVSFRGSYSTGSRRSNSFYTASSSELTDFRRFDLADRDRTRTTLGATVTPIDQLTVSLSWQEWDDNYPHSLYGTQTDNSKASGIDADWSPNSRFTIGAGYTTEDLTNVLSSRYRTGAVGSVTDNNLTYKWYAQDKGNATTTYASINAILVPDKLDVGGNFSIYDSHWQMFNVNPQVPTGGTAANIASATTETWPEVTARMTPMALFVRYHYTSDWAVTLRYQQETYNQNDFRFLAPTWTNVTGNLPAAIGNYHFLSDNFLPYNAGWVTLLISYKPSAMPFARGRPAL